MASVFISYRREDNPDAAGRIYDRLRDHFGEESVFFDIDAVPFGVDFRKHVDEVVSRCDILLVVIGDNWLCVDEQGDSRLDNPADFVRIEVEAALKRDIPVVPVPVGKASIPRADELPEAISDLCYRNAAEVRSGTAFQGHIERLIRGIESLTPARVGAQQPRKIEIPSAGTITPEMVMIPAGSFDMGSNEAGEQPVHSVRISQFALSKYTITFEQYDQFAADTERELPKDEGWGRGKQPVINVNWYDARSYTDWLSQRTGERYRLPSEAEWEYAARAGTTTEFNTGDEITKDQANIQSKQPVKVGSFAPNAFGLYDMHGNVLEWVDDCMHDDYTNAPTDGSAWTIAGIEERVLRGSSFIYGPAFARSACRTSLDASRRTEDIGFRVARDNP